MPDNAEKLRVLIPTTNGTVEVLLLREEDPSIGRSVVCIGGTTETVDIAAAYNAFVVRPTGIVESLYGHPCFRLDVSGRIDAGSSWQLGVLAAHALNAAGRLAEESDAAAGVVWATGSVRPVDLTVGAVSHVPEKIASSIEHLKQEAAAGRRVLVAMPDSNAAQLAVEQKADLAAQGMELLAVSHVRSLFDALSLPRPEEQKRNAANPSVNQSPSANRGAEIGERPRKRHAWTAVWAAAAVALLCVAAGVYYFVDRTSPTSAYSGPAPAPVSPQKDAAILVPELVPFVTERSQATIRDVYVPASDYKALALSSSQMGFVTAQADKDTAEKAAVAACQTVTDQERSRNERARPSRCELYASGNVVVSARGRPPMPQQPWIIRDPSIETPFTAKDVPLVPEASIQDIERSFATGRKFKALAISPTGIYTSYSAEPNIEQAVRRALERCGYNAGVPCMIIALDDVFAVPIPRSMKIVGFAKPATINAVAPELREDVARRLGNATSGWSAVAAGAGGRVGIKLSAATEQLAIDGSMEACGKQDHDCRVVVIGPFLVEQVSQTPDAARSSRFIAALALAVPKLTPAGREDLAQKYEALKEHKALAVVPEVSGHFRSSEWPTAEAAEEGALERCQVLHGKPCTIFAVDDALRPAPRDGKWSVRDMTRVHYAGTFDPSRIPGLTQRTRERFDVAAYRDAAGPKAAAFHPWGKLFTVLRAENQRMAEVLALSICNTDSVRQGQDGPCQLYASGNQVVLPQRRTEPLTP
jgi:hypothetical protein